VIAELILNLLESEKSLSILLHLCRAAFSQFLFIRLFEKIFEDFGNAGTKKGQSKLEYFRIMSQSKRLHFLHKSLYLDAINLDKATSTLICATAALLL
jgi:hypothetical protein